MKKAIQNLLFIIMTIVISATGLIAQPTIGTTTFDGASVPGTGFGVLPQNLEVQGWDFLITGNVGTSGSITHNGGFSPANVSIFGQSGTTTINIGSNDGSEFNFDNYVVQFFNFAGVYTITSYKDGVPVGSTTATAVSTYSVVNLSANTNFDNIDEIRLTGFGGSSVTFQVDEITISAAATPNTVPTASSFTASNGPFEDLTYTFSTSDFGYSDGDGDPLNNILIESIPGAGTLYVDADNDNTYDGGEELTISDQISKADLDAGNLQYIQNGSTNTSFQFEVNDGTENSTGNYIATLNVLPVPTVTLGLSPSSRNESISTNNTITATLSNAYGTNTTVSLAFSGTATNTWDYSRSGTSISVTAGSTTGSITLSNQSDAMYEGDETVVVDISGVTNGTENGTQQVTYTITDDDPQPLATLFLRNEYNPITDESGGDAYIVSELSAVAGVTVTVPLTFGGTATGGGTDYGISGSSIVISPGEPRDSIRVTSIFDGIEEGDETIIIDMDAPTNATEDGTQQVTLTIEDEDATFPSTSISSAIGNPTNSSPFSVSISFSEPVTGFSLGDITVGNGTASNLSGSGTTYSADITPTGDGTVTVDVAGDVAFDSFGNGNTAATQLSRVYDGTGPSTTITSTAGDPTNSTPFPVTFTFSEAVTGFTLVDIAVGNGSAANLAGSGTTYTADITPAVDGAVTVDVTAGVATDGAGNGNTAASQLSRVFDDTSPSGYSVTFDLLGESIINTINQNIIEFTGTGLEVGTTLNYSFSSDGGGTPVSGTETVTSTSETFDNSGAGYDLSSLTDGTVTLTISLTDDAGNTGSDATATASKDAGPPTGYTVSWDDALINTTEASTASFTVSNAEVGTTINNSISSSGDGNTATVSNPITVTSTNQVVTIDVSSLDDGVLTVEVSLTDAGGNTGVTVSDNTATLDQTTPSGYSVSIDQADINAANQTAASFTFAGAESGATYNYTLSSSAGGTDVTGSGTIASAIDQITGLNISSLADGTITLSVTLTDPAGNEGTAATDDVSKDATAPNFISVDDDGGDNSYKSGESLSIVADLGETGLTVTADLSVINSGLSATASMTDNTDGTYSISVADVDNGGNMIEGTSIALPLTASDGAGNQQTDNSLTLTLDKTAPAGYTVSVDQSIINATNQTAISFTFDGAEVGATYNYTLSSSAGGTGVTGSGTIATATDQITGIDISSLGDGTITLSVTLTDPAGNEGSAATDNVSKDAAAPNFISVDDDGGDNSYKSGESLTIVADLGETGLTVTADLSVINSGLSATAAMTDNTDGTYSITVTDVDNGGNMMEGTSITVPLVATDGAGNQQTDNSLTLTLDKTAPAGYTVSVDQSIINATNQAAMSFTLGGAEVGAAYSYTITSDGGGTAVTGNGTIASGTDQITGVDVSGLGDGNLTLSVTLTDVVGNEGSAVTDDVTKVTTSIAFNTTDSNGDESVANASIQVDLSINSAFDVSVDYTISGTANGGGSDYSLTNGTLTIPSGNESGSIDITGIVDDELIEGDETIILTLSNPTNASLGTNTEFIYIINDNDEAEISLVATSQAEEDDVDGLYTVSTSKQFANDVALTFTISGTATEGADIESLGTSVIFPASTNSINIPVVVIADTEVEEDETVILNLESTDNTAVLIGSENSATVTITDNDERHPQTITFDPIADKKLSEGEVILEATGGDSGEPITYTISTDPVSGVATLSNGAIMLEGVGAVTVTASQTGNNSYLPAEDVSQSFSILSDELLLPTLFTPNNDRINDVLLIRGDAAVQSVSFRIYDRNGNLVFESDSFQELTEVGWDGMKNGVNQPAGTYVWVISGRMTNGEPIKVNGSNRGTILIAR